MISEPLPAHGIPSPLVVDAAPDRPARLRHQCVAIGREQDRRAMT